MRNFDEDNHAFKFQDTKPPTAGWHLPLTIDGTFKQLSLAHHHQQLMAYTISEYKNKPRKDEPAFIHFARRYTYGSNFSPTPRSTVQSVAEHEFLSSIDHCIVFLHHFYKAH